MSKRWLVLNTYHCPYISWLCWAPHPWAPRGHLKVNVSVLLKFLRNSQACKFTPKAGNKVQLHNSMAWWIWEIKVRDRMPNHHNYNQIQLSWKEFGPVKLIRQSLQTFFQRVSFEPLFVYIYAKNMNSGKKIEQSTMKRVENHWFNHDLSRAQESKLQKIKLLILFTLYATRRQKFSVAPQKLTWCQ